MELDTIEMLSKQGYSSDLRVAVENYLLFNPKTEKKDSLKILFIDRLRQYISNDEFCEGIRRLFESIGHRPPADAPQPNSKP
jgi:hypothetical protein